MLRVVRNRFLRHLKEAEICVQVSGVRSLVPFSANLIVGRPEYLTVRSRNLKGPVFLRLHTSDALTYRDTFIDKEYQFDLDFAPRTVVDAGANCGLTAIFYANRYPKAKIIAIEPEASNFEALMKNVSAYPQITAIRAALWNQDGEVDLFSGWPRTANWGKWGFRVRQGVGCTALTVPTLMKQHNLTSIDILKVDVEGAEREIFADCHWMNQVKHLAIELHDRHWPGCSTIVDQAAKGFQKVTRDPVTFYSH